MCHASVSGGVDTFGIQRSAARNIKLSPNITADRCRYPVWPTRVRWWCSTVPDLVADAGCVYHSSIISYIEPAANRNFKACRLVTAALWVASSCDMVGKACLLHKLGSLTVYSVRQWAKPAATVHRRAGSAPRRNWRGRSCCRRARARRDR